MLAFVLGPIKALNININDWKLQTKLYILNSFLTYRYTAGVDSHSAGDGLREAGRVHVAGADHAARGGAGVPPDGAEGNPRPPSVIPSEVGKGV